MLNCVKDLKVIVVLWKRFFHLLQEHLCLIYATMWKCSAFHATFISSVKGYTASVPQIVRSAMHDGSADSHNYRYNKELYRNVPECVVFIMVSLPQRMRSAACLIRAWRRRFRLQSFWGALLQSSIIHMGAINRVLALKINKKYWRLQAEMPNIKAKLY